MKQHLTVGLAPDEAHRQTPAQLPARGLVADAPVEAGAKDVTLRFRHGPLQPQQEPIVKQPRMVESVVIADQGIGHAAQVQQPVPVGIVACQTRDLQP